MPKPSIFIGSSSEQLEVVKEIEVHLAKFAEVTCWDGIFNPGQSFITDLSKNKDNYDFAIFVITPDDTLVSRGVEYLSVRDNVIFEMGLFIGSIGSERVYCVTDQNRKGKILSDYHGITFLSYDGNRGDNDLSKALSPVCTQIKRAVERIGINKRNSTTEDFHGIDSSNIIGLSKIYSNYDEAEKDIIKDLKTTHGPVRLFFQVASSNMGAKGKLFEILDELVNQRKVDVRILHAAETSKLFSRERLISIGKDPDTVLSTLNYVNTSLKNIESKQGSSLLRRTHGFPYLWRMYAFESHLYLMPYFSMKDAAAQSPVLLFSRQDKSMYDTFIDWFDHAWEVFAPKEISISDMITPSTPSGTALFLKWQDYHVFGIPKRDLIEESDYLRFFGVGGKKHPDESYEDCAIREGNEETDNSIEDLKDSRSTYFLKSIGTLEKIKIINAKKTPRLVLERKNHSGYGNMSKLSNIYYLLAFDATLSKKPKASGELAALVFMQDYHLSIIKNRNDLSIGELIEQGMILEEQEGVNIDRSKTLVPYGTAVYLIRKLP